LDVQLHDLLKKPTGRPLAPPPPSAKPLTLPEPVFPQHPELLTEEELEADKHGSPAHPYKRPWTLPLVYRAMRGWLFPYLKSRLLRPEVIDRVADAGVAVVNFAVDAVEENLGLPKALAPVRKYFDYLIKKQYRYGYAVFFNINICKNNLEDVQQLTEIAHHNGIATDYHINESPMLEEAHFQHMQNNVTFIEKEDWPRVDVLIDWLIEKNRSGYKMVNSVRRLNDMKAFMREKVEPWNCRAGQNSLIIRVDGTLAPCFPMYSATYDWGVVGDHNFEVSQLNEMKKECQTHCFSTLNHNLSYCYDAARALKWVLKQASRGFQGTSGSFQE
jgi:MoaA/NifB/PqqE/SkfB family radical SAM enzyme